MSVKSYTIGIVFGVLLYLTFLLLTRRSTNDIPALRVHELQRDAERNFVAPVKNTIDLKGISPKAKDPVELKKLPNDAQCLQWLIEHNVAPGISWGTLPETHQRLWSSMECNKVVEAKNNKVDPSATSKVEPTPVKDPITSALAAVDKPSNIHFKQTEQAGDGKHDGTALSSVTEQTKEWCLDMKRKFDVQPMKSWGKLPHNLQDTWKAKTCDLVFTTMRMRQKSVASCINWNGVNKDIPADQQESMKSSMLKFNRGNKLPNLNPDLPLIAVMAATTTRKIKNPSTKNLALFMYLLPSLIRTVDCGYRYEYVLGYDKGDPFYDSDEGLSEVRNWFKNKIQAPMERQGISIQLRLVRVNNTLKKPGPVFIEMARAAYQAGATYFYRINDDTELDAHWPSKFVRALHSLPQPYGVVGPNCNQGNQKILTHDFVHRVHMEVFGMNYYPPELTDWWMDDWISLVYGQQRTFKAREVPVIHHTGAHGQRYEVDRSHEKLLEELVVDGRKKIRQWMLLHNVPEEELRQFDKDVYKAGFQHRDIPHHISFKQGRR